jgi:iron(III) transport system ATP-binding protein
MTSIRLENISKRFGQTVALDQIDLKVEAGELFFLLGPSGCGKSTLLRLIAGLNQPTSGRIFFGDREVTALATERRNAVMVFQSYALWPHMTVRDNVRFGLEVRKTPRHEQDAKVSQVLDLVRMGHLASRKPNELSGGQQQRVALARALVVHPDCLLLDEPLSNLDAKLRHEMRSEIRHICKSQGVTTIYVTHDQKEAMSVADRIAVMNAGRIVQVGTPAGLYQTPCNSFVAGFMGETNLLPGNVIERDAATVRVQTPAGVVVAGANSNLTDLVVLSIRPEKIRISHSPGRNGGTMNHLTGRLIETTFLGETSENLVLINGQRLKAVSANGPLEVSSEVTAEFEARDVVLLPPEETACDTAT